ncbi:uncharacterized protein [Dermacentor andersoni]|uniref:uncharacterized protein n=1 Tax=Dermacentor andersoni TaxID=34620 RepID=UPI002155A99C|nr:TNF receptor-associated factor 6-like [Dermacentor andersoni]
MLPAGLRYTLVGFSDTLDWKPVDFVKPIPPDRVCAVCGLVRAVTALLPCGHSLCECCSQQCAADDGYHCPLDGDRYTDGDVDWRSLAAESLLQREVYCWNKPSGCEAVLTASEVHKHFQTECRYHSAFCPRCSETVLCNSMCAHIRLNCRTSVAPNTSENAQQVSQKGDSALRQATNQFLENPVAEIKAALLSIISACSAHSNTLNSVAQTINSIGGKTEQCRVDIKEVVETFAGAAVVIGEINELVKRSFVTSNASSERISEGIGALQDMINNLATNHQHHTAAEAAAQMEAIKMGVAESSQIALHATERALAHYSIALALYHFVVRRISEKKQAAIGVGQCTYLCDKIYLRGYCITPGLCFRRNNGSVSLHIPIAFHKGAVDDSIEWPFKKTIKLSIVHPITGLQRDMRKICRKVKGAFLQKPVECSNEAGFFESSTISLNDLERDGFVHNDQLQCTWHILER